jgi:hypothetical protein
MADHDLVVIAAVSTSYNVPRIAIIKGSESNQGEIPFSNITIKFKDVVIGPDPSVDPPGEITFDPRVLSIPTNPKSENAIIILDRHFPGRVIPPAPPWASVISKFPSNLSAVAMEAAIASDSAPNLTQWGGSTNVPSANASLNLYGALRLGDIGILASYDLPRVAQIDLTDDSVVGAVDYTPQAGLQAGMQGLLLTPNGTIIALINEFVNQWGGTPALAGYVASTLVEVVPGVNGAPPTFSTTNRVTVTQTVDEVTYNLLNGFKLAYADGNILVAGFGGPQMYGQSNVDRSTIFKIPVSNAGALGEPSVIYHGYDDDTFYDIRDIVVNGDTAMILLGGYEVDERTFDYILLRQPLDNTTDPDDQPVIGLLNTQAADIMDLVGEAWAVLDGDAVYGGACHALDYEGTYKHFWAVQSTRLRVYDGTDISDLATAIPGNKEFLPSDYYDADEAYVNAFDVFSKNTIYVAPSAVLRAVHGGGGASSSSVAGRHAKIKAGKAAVRAFIDKARAIKKQKRGK